jgi:hypothetical protein
MSTGDLTMVGNTWAYSDCTTASTGNFKICVDYSYNDAKDYKYKKEMLRCDYCACKIQHDAPFCPYCGGPAPD